MQRALAKIRAKNPDLAAAIQQRGGFIISTETAALIEVDRLMLVLVRCGCGRFLCPVQDLNHFLTIIQEHADLKEKATGQPFQGDYVRDVSLPSES